MSAAVIAVDGLRVSYGNIQALDGIDVEVARGSTLGVLGHNGAGKTTLIRVLTTLVRPDAGRVLVDGFDVVRQADQVRQRIGVTGQYAGLDDFLTGRENLELLGRLAGLGHAARARADALIERLDLQDVAQRRVGEMSGGSRRRIDLAASLIAAPSVLVLDEPTTGLDPIARSALWGVLEDLTANGTTIVLTTQYLDEADRLADDILVLAHGRVVARGEPTELKRIVGDKVITATIPAAHVDRLLRRPNTERKLSSDRVRVSFTADDAATAADVVADLGRVGVDIGDLTVISPSLDDVFTHLTLTGAGT
ncbi:MAG TPA: ATP-binding cassette domain-containing protein [Acidimicrobiales bacterium]|nr:ATP-binding cassette domain-containing protein [Acidimicrobiales bacterium]